LKEIVVNTWTHDPEARQHSYALLAGAFGLERRVEGNVQDGEASTRAIES
jgi:hypothetical protein